MWQAVRSHLVTCLEEFGSGWNRFWFAPSDPAALGLVRIATGLLALYWQLTYTPDLVTLFGSQALIPLESLDKWQAEAMVFSYFDERLSPATLYGLHFAGTAVLLLFTLGVFTRITSVLALVVTLSYIHRGPMLTMQMEPILAFVQFYLCLGPSGAVFSFDAWRRRRQDAEKAIESRPRASSWSTVALRLLQVHVTLVYVMMALGKVGSPAWWNGSAIWWLVARPESQGNWLTGYLAPNLSLIEGWTHAHLLFEMAFPLFVWNRLTRPFVLLLAVPMWILLGLATGLYTFAAMMLVANLCFVPPQVVRALFDRAGRADRANAAVVTTSESSSKKLAAKPMLASFKRSGQSA